MFLKRYYVPYGTICEGEICPCPALGNSAPPTDRSGNCCHFWVYSELPLHPAEFGGGGGGFPGNR